MSLKKNETDLEMIFTALAKKDNKERSKAISRLKSISKELSTDEHVKVRYQLVQALTSESDGKLKKRISYLIENIYNEEQIESIEFDYEEPEHLEFELGEPIPKKTPKKRVKESDVLRRSSFKSMRSENRFPFHTLYMEFIRIVAALFAGFMVIMALWALSEEFIEGFIAYLMIGGIGGFSILLSSEVIRFILDFHDSNYANTKVRIETLKVLRDINNNIKK